GHSPRGFALGLEFSTGEISDAPVGRWRRSLGSSVAQEALDTLRESVVPVRKATVLLKLV
ncbi:MAG: hypothetical protein AAF488_20135, partial [Planctomycetota bacterium]